jgi:alkylation response protein AidB-like acyl-CoA dehydrogenase
MVGEMDTLLAGAKLALDRMVEMATTGFKPGVGLSNRVYQYKTITANSSIQAVEKAMMVMGGRSFYRNAGLERAFRDVQGARFHPFQEQKQYEFSGRVALGMDPVA